MNKVLEASLVANGFGFSLHWIYDPKTIQRIIETEEVFFKKPLQQHYDQAESSFFGYPHASDGDVTTQGMFLLWLSEALKSNPNLSVEDYKHVLLSHIMPGADYVGYIESYAKKLIANEIALSMEHEPIFEMVDDHLVGFVPYLACKALNLPTSKAKELASLFSSDEDYGKLFDVFDEFVEGLTVENKQSKLKIMIEHAPFTFQTKLKQACENTSDDIFLEQYSGIACVIPQSIPLIIRIIHKASTFEEAMLMNVAYGGAISERAMMLGYVFSLLSMTPPTWSLKLNPKLYSRIQSI